MAIWTVRAYGTHPDGTTSGQPSDSVRLLSIECDSLETPAICNKYLEIGKTFLTWSDNTPIKRMAKSSLAKRRKTRLRTKLMKKHPLFFQDFYDSELADRPGFYDGERPDD